MTIIAEERLSDSPYIETIIHGHSIGAGSTIRPAEIHWHMVFVKHEGNVHPLVVGPLKSSGIASWGGEAEFLWIKFKLGTFIPHLPVKNFLDKETTLPGASSNSFWLHGSAWQFPDFNNVETFIDRLVHDESLARDPVVNAVLQDQPQNIPSRTVRHRFLHSTGLTQIHIRQYERAQHAHILLLQGKSILDTVHEAGYFDQPHLTRALKHWIGYTPAQIAQRYVQERCGNLSLPA
jgi:AraC-like DNA-binding protein